MRTVRFRTLALVSLLAALMILGYAPAAAQVAPQPVTLGTPATGEVSAANIAPAFLVTATAPQSLTIQVEAVTPGFAPGVRVLNSAGGLVQDIPNPTGLGQLQAVVQLPQAGQYIIQVQSANGFGGQFTLSVGEGVTPPTPLALGTAVRGTLNVQTPIMRYSFDAADTQVLQLLITATAPSDGTVVLTNEAGDEVARFSLRLLAGRFDIPAATGPYLLTLSHSGLGTNETFSIILSPVQGAVAVPATAVPVVQPTRTPLLPLPTTGQCVVASFSGVRVNLRRGPSTAEQVLAQISGNQTANVIGRLADNSWLQVNYNGTIAWVATNVIRQGGNCSAVPVAAGPGLPSAATPIPAATFIPQPGGAVDLVITGASVTPNPISEDQQFAVNATVTNQGGGTAVNVLLQLGITGDMNVQVPNSAATIAQLPPGSSITVNFVGNIAENNGNAHVRLAVDPNNSIAETNEGNNVSELDVSVLEDEPDLYVQDIDIDDADDDNDQTRIRVTIRNQGGVDATDFSVQVSFSPEAVGAQNFSFENVAANSSEGRTLELDIPEGDYTVTVRVDTGNNVDEISEDNNEASENFHVD